MKYLVVFILLQFVMFNNGILQAQWVKTSGPAYEKQVNSSTTILSNGWILDRKSTRLNSSHLGISYAVFCLKKKKKSYLNKSDRSTPPPMHLSRTRVRAP